MSWVINTLKQHNNSLGGISRPNLVLTQDGSFTLKSLQYDECYHNVKTGAYKESYRTHIFPAFTHHINTESICILDICFGLGFNTFVAIQEAIKRGYKKVIIHSPELDEGLLESLNFFEYGECFDDIKGIVKQVIETRCYKDDIFEIRVFVGDARKFIEETTSTYNIVFQDAFSPKKNPLLWTQEYFYRLHQITSDDMIMTSYSQASSVRYSMFESGFYIYNNPQENDLKDGTIALKRLDCGREFIDMNLKKQRNANLKAMYDKEY